MGERRWPAQGGICRHHRSAGRLAGEGVRRSRASAPVVPRWRPPIRFRRRCLPASPVRVLPSTPVRRRTPQARRRAPLPGSACPSIDPPNPRRSASVGAVNPNFPESAASSISLERAAIPCLTACLVVLRPVQGIALLAVLVCRLVRRSPVVRGRAGAAATIGSGGRRESKLDANTCCPVRPGQAWSRKDVPYAHGCGRIEGRDNTIVGSILVPGKCAAPRRGLRSGPLIRL